MIKQSLALASALALSTSVSFAATHVEANHIGIVDFQKLFKSAPQGEKAFNQDKMTLGKQLSQIKAEVKKLKVELGNFKKNKATYSKKELQSHTQKIEHDQETYQDHYQTYLKDLQKDKLAVLESFSKAAKKAVKSVAKQHHYDLVLNAQSVPYFGQAHDITDLVLAKMK